MPRVIDVDVDEQRIKISFPYDQELVQVVRTLPDRWYENRSKNWFVPLEHLDYVIERLDGYHFKFSPALRNYRDKQDDASSAKPAVQKVPEGTWTISRLNQAAQAALQERFDDIIWVVGELQDFDKNRASNYSTYFFDLVERPVPGASEVAKIKAVLFERHRKKIAKKLRDSDIELNDGLAVRIGGAVDLYAKNGRYQLRVKDIDPAYTAGEIELNRERVFRALKSRGIEADNLNRSWPVCPLNVGLITSYESDAYNDFVHQLKESGRRFSLTVHDANVQGAHTERSVLRALRYFQRRAADFDVVAIVRGGGSRSELAHFDTEPIGEAVCNHPVKIISGVGHQRDTCLLDMIAEPTKTPTAAADAIVRRVDEFRNTIEDRYQAIARLAGRQLDAEQRRLVRCGAKLERRVVESLGEARRRQDRLEGAIAEAARGAVSGRRRGLDAHQRQLRAAVGHSADRRRRQIDRARQKLSVPRFRRRFDRLRNTLDDRIDALRKSVRRDAESERTRLQHLEEQLQLLDPQQILERGFAVVRNDQGVIRSRDDLDVGDDFDVMVGDGVLRARRLDDDAVERETTTEEPASEPAE